MCRVSERVALDTKDHVRAHQGHVLRRRFSRSVETEGSRRVHMAPPVPASINQIYGRCLSLTDHYALHGHHLTVYYQ